MTHDIHHAYPIQAPADILARLQEIDENAHVFYVGGGMWALGRVSPDFERQSFARRLLISELNQPPQKQRPDVVRLYRLHAQGFRMTGLCSSKDVYEGHVVRDFRERFYNAENAREAAMKARLAESEKLFDADRKRARIQDMLESEAKSMHSILFRHRKSVHFN